jgi:hypothetical protein
MGKQLARKIDQDFQQHVPGLVAARVAAHATQRLISIARSDGCTNLELARRAEFSHRIAGKLFRLSVDCLALRIPAQERRELLSRRHHVHVDAPLQVEAHQASLAIHQLHQPIVHRKVILSRQHRPQLRR